MTPGELRALLPALQGVTWMNAAASSPLPRPVADALRAHVDECELRGDAGLARWLALKEQVRAGLARLLGAATPGEVGFVPSTSYGFMAAARLLQARGVREVVTLGAEFPSTTLPLLHAGLRLRAVRPRPDGSFPVEDVAAALTPQTGAVALSQVQYASGFHADVAAVGRLCRDRGLLFALNACQAVGQVPVDVQASGAHLCAGTSHKWMMAGFGGGFLYVRQGLMDGLPPPWAGWLSPERAWEMDPFAGAQAHDEGNVRVVEGARFREGPSVLEAGSHAWTPYVGLAAALGLLESLGMEAVAAHNRALQGQLRAGLRRRGFVPNAPDAQAAGICVVRVEGAAEEAVRALLKEGVSTTPRGGGIRISTHAYNTPDDVDRCLHAMVRVGLRPDTRDT
jgi:cysteine desulfurase/selenocysteine lyase